MCAQNPTSPTTPAPVAARAPAQAAPRINIAERRHQPNLEPVITRMRHPLMPLHPLPYGAPHPAFPRTLLQYNLLTEEQMDSFASYYHQRPFTPRSVLPPLANVNSDASACRVAEPFPSIWTGAYPATMDWDDEYLAYVGERYGVEARARIKRRKVGKFIGLRGCLTPMAEAEDYQRWRQRRLRVVPKGDSFAFWGRRGRWN